MTTTERDLRRLDSLIAEKVMGHQVGRTSDVGPVWESGPDINTGGRSDFLRSYSKDISATWWVVERMRELEFGFELHRWNTEGMRHPYEAKFYPDAFGEFVAEADSAPLAICLAALRALGVEAR